MSLHTETVVRQFPESDTTGGITEGAESSNGTAAQSHSQSSEKPFGSAAARFKIRSAKTLQRKCEPTSKDLRMISNIFEGGKVEDSSQKSDPGKGLNKVCTSSASCTQTDINDKKTGKNLGNGTTKDSALSINSEKGDVSAKQSSTQEEESQTASDRSRGDDLKRYQSNKSKSLDFRGTSSRAGCGNRTGIRDSGHFMTRSSSFEKTAANIKITSYTQENHPCRVSLRIQAYSGANQNPDRKVYPISGSTSVRMNRASFGLEQASSGQSLPVRLKPRQSQCSIEEGSSLWAQQQGELSLDQTERMRSREQGPSNSEEVTGNQTIMERIEKLYGRTTPGTDAKSDAHSKNSIGLKRNNTLTSDKSFSKSMDTVDSTPSHRKYTTDFVFGTSSDSSDSQQGNVGKARTLPRGFPKTYLGPKQEPFTNRENKNDQRDNSSGLTFSMSSMPKGSTEMSSVKKVKSLLPEDKEETSRRPPKYCSQSLERTRSRLSATAQHNAHSSQLCSDSSSNMSSQGVKHLLTTTRGIKEEIGKVNQLDKESTKRLDINENKYLGGLQDGITQPKYPLASKGAAHNEIHKEEEKDEVFTDKTEGRRGEGVLEKLHVPSFDSVKNTISKFESLVQQSKRTPEILLTRRSLSVQEHHKPVALVKKSDSDKNLHFGRVVGNTESLRTNFLNKSDSNEENEGTLDTSRTPHSNSKVRPTLERQETYKKSVELSPAFKQMNKSRTDQVINRSDEDERTIVNKTHTDEPDSAITVTSGLRKIGTIEEEARMPSISQQSNVKSLLKQQTINVKIVNDDDNDENTPTNSPDRAPLTVSMQKQINPGAVTINVNGTHSKALPNLSQSFTPVQTTILNHSNNNNYEITRIDCTILTTSKARWSSDEEDDDDEETETEEDSDSGESSVTITSNMSQSERRSFSLSLVDLCNYGGVDYKQSDGSLSEDGEDLPSTRSASLSSDVSAFSSVTLLSTDELDRLLDDVRGLGDDTLQKYEDVQVVVLHKEVGSGLGFTLAGGVDQNKPVTVHRVISGGVAAQEGSIFEGARVLSINGTALQNSAHWEALRTLRKARGQGMAVVVLQSSNSRKEATERPGITGRRVRVTLNKSSSDLGFSLEGGVGSSSGDKPLSVQKIFQGGPVSEVFPGDELLEVQGQSLVGMMRLEAWNLIKKLPTGPVDVLLHRHHQPR